MTIVRGFKRKPFIQKNNIFSLDWYVNNIEDQDYYILE